MERLFESGRGCFPGAVFVFGRVVRGADVYRRIGVNAERRDEC